MGTSELYGAFPALQASEHLVTSPEDRSYNCIAWAAGDSSRWWWPDPEEVAYWPASVERAETTASFVAAFSLLGYAVCPTSDLEPGLEKVALYLRNGRPTHAARQLRNGKWSSKFGRLEDVEHTLDSLAGGPYGEVGAVLSRPRRL